MPSRALATVVAALLLTLATAGFAPAQAPTMVILVRHAEKAAAPAKDPPLTDAGRARAGHTVLVVGHSHTIPAIIAALVAPEPSEICDAEYDDLFIVTVPAAGKATLVRAKYGARSDVVSCAAMK